MRHVIALLFSLLMLPAAGAAPVYVEPAWLATKLADPGIVIVDMTDDPQYLRYHIPGAVRLDYDELVQTRPVDKVSLRLTDPQLFQRLGALGISRDSHVIIYDDMAGLNAGRLFWELERIGHPQVSVLRGGLVQWVLSGQRVDNIAVPPRTVVYQAVGKGLDNEAGLTEVVAAGTDDKTVLLDVRSPEEYLGHPRLRRSGHIPGARSWPWQDGVDFNAGFVPKPEPLLRNSLQAQGVSGNDTPVVLYCQSGHRAAQGYLTLRGLGYRHIKLYDGSMAEYGQHLELPLVMGREPR